MYYDNRSFLFYHRRLERLEGASLVRVRWYSEDDRDPNAIRPDHDVYVEIKDHHEAWSGERSTKRRFAIKEKNADSYFHGTFDLVPVIEKLEKKGHQ